MPNAKQAALEKLGLALVDPEDSPRAYAELLRMARRVRESHRRAVGLLPASPPVAVPAVAIQLAAVMADVCAGPIAFVDANTRWPALAAVAPHGDPQADGSARVTLCRGVVAFTRPPSQDDRIDVDWLQDTLDERAHGFAHVLVDLTGFASMGEHARAFDMLDGVLVVARAGVSREGDLLALQAQVPRARMMGVLLSG